MKEQEGSDSNFFALDNSQSFPSPKVSLIMRDTLPTKGQLNFESRPSPPETILRSRSIRHSPLGGRSRRPNCSIGGR
jgi:hypothetical protein